MPHSPAGAFPPFVARMVVLAQRKAVALQTPLFMDDDLIQNVLIDDIVSILRALIAAAEVEPDPKAVVAAAVRPGVHWLVSIRVLL